jgi:hypothetical protein
LITNETFIGNNIVTVNPSFSIQNVLDKLKVTLEYRFNELQEGKLEIGEGSKLADLELFHKAGIILPPHDSKKKEKKQNSYSGYDLFKGLIK